jgi:hypothetical protein
MIEALPEEGVEPKQITHSLASLEQIDPILRASITYCSRLKVHHVALIIINFAIEGTDETLVTTHLLGFGGVVLTVVPALTKVNRHGTSKQLCEVLRYTLSPAQVGV